MRFVLQEGRDGEVEERVGNVRGCTMWMDPDTLLATPTGFEPVLPG